MGYLTGLLPFIGDICLISVVDVVVVAVPVVGKGCVVVVEWSSWLNIVIESIVDAPLSLL